MKTLRITIIIFAIHLFGIAAFGQSTSNPFEDQGSFLSYFSGKVFSNSETGMTLSYGYISSFNTYGISLKTKKGTQVYFINCDIRLYSSFATVTGTDPDDGASHKITFYKDKLSFSNGLFYPK